MKQPHCKHLKEGFCARCIYEHLNERELQRRNDFRLLTAPDLNGTFEHGRRYQTAVVNCNEFARAMGDPDWLLCRRVRWCPDMKKFVIEVVVDAQNPRFRHPMFDERLGSHASDPPESPAWVLLNCFHGTPVVVRFMREDSP